MIVTGIDVGADVALAASEGMAALSVGATDRARVRFAEAGKALEGRIAGRRRQQDKHLIRFLAASQYYHGGAYQKALELARRVDPNFLPDDVRPLFPNFLRDAKERASEQYPARIRKKGLAYWEQKDHKAILELLYKHPYVLPEADMAFFRANCCESMGDYHAAAVFYGDAIKGKPAEDPRIVLTAIVCPLTLMQEGKLAEAWKYVHYQLKEFPHTVTYITACRVRSYQASATASEGERRSLRQEQMHYFQEAWRSYQLLPERVKADREFHDYMTLCFVTVTLGLRQEGQMVQAQEVCATAVAFAPDAGWPQALRGAILGPGDGGVEDFAEAIQFEEQPYPTASGMDFESEVERALKRRIGQEYIAELESRVVRNWSQQNCLEELLTVAGKG